MELIANHHSLNLNWKNNNQNRKLSVKAAKKVMDFFKRREARVRLFGYKLFNTYFTIIIGLYNY